MLFMAQAAIMTHQQVKPEMQSILQINLGTSTRVILNLNKDFGFI